MRRLALISSLALVVAGCSSRECDSELDCPWGYGCDGLGQCFERGGFGTGGGRDATVGADAAPGPDAGLDATLGPDAAPGIDVGPRPDAGRADGGPAPDGGTGPGPGLYGFVWAGELRADGGSAFHAYGLLEDRSAATYEDRTQSVPDDEGGACTVRVRRLSAGAPTGLVANSITVAPGGAMAPPSIAYFPAGGGRFEPLAPLPPRIYSQSPLVGFGIVGTGMPGSIDSTPFFSVPPPSVVFEQTPPEGGVVLLQGGPAFAWAAGEPTARVVIEAFDADREVVMRCETADDGAFSVPPMAAAGFLAEAPARPWTLEIRHDEEVTAPAVVDARTFDVTYRASWGARFSVE